MKSKILLLILLSQAFCWSQTKIDTKYVRSKNGSFCGEESFVFLFYNDDFIRIDSSDRGKISGPSRKTDTNYDDSGIYYEIRTPAYKLEEVGVTEYRRYNHYLHRIGYNKKGGNVLYVYEVDGDTGGDGKFYFTELGYQQLCKNQ